MKRTFTVSILIIICYMLQCTLFQYLKLGGIVPNLLLIITVSFAIIRGKNEGAIIGFFCGILIDIFFGNVVGFYALMYMYIGFINGFTHKLFYRDNLLIPMFVIAISDIIYNLGIYLTTYLLRGKLDLDYYFTRIMLPEVVYTTLIALFLYKLILMLNDKLEAREKGVY